MSKSDTSIRKGRRFFGPGTILALVAAVGIVASGWLSGRDQAPGRSGTIAYQADARGRMRRVDTPSVPATPPLPPLWKPDPGMVSAHGAELKLDASQRRGAETLAAEWRREEAQWQAEMSRALGGTQASAQQSAPGRRLSLAQIRQGMSDYSAVSREYDGRRADAWARANALLTPAQRLHLETLAHRKRTARLP